MLTMPSFSRSIEEKPVERMDGKILSGVSDQLKFRYEQVVAQLSAESDRYFKTSDVPLFKPILVLHRPVSSIIKCRVRSLNYDNVVYLKFCEVGDYEQEKMEKWKKRMVKDFDVMTRLHELFKGNPVCTVPRGLEYFPKEMAMVTEESDGESFLKLITGFSAGIHRKKANEDLRNSCFRVGQWLSEFQRLTKAYRIIHEMEEELVPYVDHRLCKLVQAGCLSTSQREQTLRYLASHLDASSGGDEERCGVHGDFSMSNILVSTHAVSVLDFAMYRVGSPYVDLAYLYRKFRHSLMNNLIKTRAILLLQNSFLEGYQPNFDRHHPLFVIQCVRHLVNRLVSLAVDNKHSPLKRIYQRALVRIDLQELNQIIRLH